MDTIDAPTGVTEDVENVRQLDMDSRYLWIGVGTLVILLFVPSLFFITMLGIVLGFCSLDLVKEQIQPLLRNHVKRKISEDRKYDPLLHPDTREPSLTSIRVCKVCNTSINSCSCSRDLDLDQPRPRPKSSWSTLQISQDLRIDPRLDAALARFCNAVFAEYVSPDWAPYESRMELKRALVKTLLTFGQGVQATFLTNEEDSIIFVRQKVLPLFLYHVNSIREKRRMSSEEEEEAYKKVMALTKILLQKFLNPEDSKCKLWTELVLAVLGSGVFWNLILLGRREIPILLQELHEESKMATPAEQLSSASESDTESATTSPPPSPSSLDGKDKEYVSLLLDSFLDPAKDVEQPSAISSRYRPTMNYVHKESDLLYCLIQFLKGEGALEWLQTFLEQENAEANAFPRRVIEIKHLNHFARSKIFLENLGFSRLEAAHEVDPDLYPSVNLKPTHHTRSSSYGGGANSGGLFEKKVVDGLAIYPSSLVNPPIRAVIPGAPSASALPSPPAESDSLFRRRDTLEPFIAKFYASLIQPQEEPGNEMLAKEALPAKRRVGVDAKVRRRASIKRVVISDKPKDVLETLTSTVISLIRKDSPWKGVIGGWIEFLRPILNDQLMTLIDEWTGKALALENVLFLINLITDAFIESNDPKLKELKQKQKANTGTGSGHRGRSINEAPQFLSVEWFLESLFDKEELLNTLCSYPDGILLFFVDLLDLLVSALTQPISHS